MGWQRTIQWTLEYLSPLIVIFCSPLQACTILKSGFIAKPPEIRIPYLPQALTRNWLQLDLYTPWIPSLLRDLRSQGFDTKMVDNWSEASSRLWAFTIVGYSHRISSCAYSGMESLFFFPNFLFMVSSFRTRQTRITALKITKLHMLTMLLFILHQLIRLSQPRAWRSTMARELVHSALNFLF